MTCEEFRECADALALGALAPEEAEAARLHLGLCKACAAVYRPAARVAEQLPLSVPLVQAPAGLRSAVFAAIHEDAGTPSSGQGGDVSARPSFSGAQSEVGSAAAHVVHIADTSDVRAGERAARMRSFTRGSFQLPVLAAAAVLVAIVGLAGWTFWLHTQVDDLKRTQQLSAYAFSTAVPGDAALSTLARAGADALVLMSSPGTVGAPLNPTTATTGPDGAVFWNPSQQRCVVLVRQLVPLGGGREYHVWFGAGDHRWDGGSVIPDVNGIAELVVATDRWQLGTDYTINVVVQRVPGDGTWDPVLTASVAAPAQ